MRATGQSELAMLIRQERDGLLSTWRQQVKQLPSAQHLNTPTLNDHIPGLLEELAEALRSRSEQTISEALAEGSPPVHGSERFREGYDIEEVVAEYNILRGCIHDLAENNGLSLRRESFHITNRVLDQAIGLAVKAYAAQQALEVQKRREEYLAFVAHDLRTPLNAIAVAANVLEDAFRDGSTGDIDSAWMLRALRRNVQQLQSLVEKIIEENTNLRSENGIKLERREFDLWPLVEGLIYDLRPKAQSNSTRLVNEVPHDLVAYADASLLRRIFQNLLSNAIKHTSHGVVTISACHSDPTVQCWVRDTGTGIPKEHLDKVFEKFESGSEGGLGLGLAIVKTFVEAHGGSVSVRSQPMVGSEFRFILPTKDRREQAAITDREPMPAATAKI
jgi:two-component system, OmpR family, phosphate regulon sensor histidine kinase PhoR